MVEPISLKEAPQKKEQLLPGFVIEAFNNVIAKNLSNGYSRFLQKEVVAEMIRLSEDSVTVDEMFKKKYLDVEGIYRKKGWIVSFEGPAYCESFEPYFTFKEKR